MRLHLFNGLSLTMPYLGPFLVQTLREAVLDINNKPLQADIREFKGQEASHCKCHRQLSLGIITGLFDRQVEYRTRTIAWLFDKRAGLYVE